MQTLPQLYAAQPRDLPVIHEVLSELGFAEAPRAVRLLDDLAKSPEDKAALLRVLESLAESLTESADPMRALLNLSRLFDVVPNRAALLDELCAAPNFRERVTQLFSWSQVLTDRIIRDPQLLGDLKDEPQNISRPQLRQLARQATHEYSTENEKLDALRRFRARQTLRIALLDLERQTWRDEDGFREVVRGISDLAQVCVEEALHVLGGDNQPFCVLGMGKLGARELNYSSDLDLIFIHDGETQEMLTLGEKLFKALGDSTAAGNIHRVDMRLRPDGKSGPLVTNIAYALSYYESYAAAWEWQAMIKVRAVGGDAKLARRFRKFMRGITWARRADDAHLREMMHLKKRSETTSEGKDARNVKQGPGGIRDAEWVVQQLQMMTGPVHKRVRASATLRALKELHEIEAITFEQLRSLRDGYLFLRVLEHRLQLWEERAVRQAPQKEADCAALARRLGFTARGAAAARQLNEELERHQKEVRDLCEDMFWQWRDEVEPHFDMAQLPSDDARRRIERLAEGTSTQPLPAPLARQIRAVMPDALAHLGHAADPERAVLNLEKLCDASGNRLALLRSLAGEATLARAVFAILGGSQWLSDTLVNFPQLLDMAANRALLSQPRSMEEARSLCRDYCYPFRDREAALRRWKSREMLRIGMRDLALDTTAPEIAEEIAFLAQACISFASEEVKARRRPYSENVAFAVLGMGKLGGAELHYSSDADVIFVYENLAPSERNLDEATAWAEDLMRFCGARSEAGIAFEIDPRLRPDGRSGPLVRTAEGFRDYFERANNGIAVWERQALTRARYVAGDTTAAARLMAAIRHVAFPEKWNPEWGDELRHIKSRVENERAAKGIGVYDVKLGKGGLSDIEFCAQWLALKHGAKYEELQTPNTLRQIEAAQSVGLLSDDERDALRDTYIFLRRAELRLQITQEHAVKALKRGAKEWTSWARSVFPDCEDAAQIFETTWESSTRKARAVMERVRDEL